MGTGQLLSGRHLSHSGIHYAIIPGLSRGGEGRPGNVRALEPASAGLRRLSSICSLS